jgi:hypothetical protein
MFGTGQLEDSNGFIISEKHYFIFILLFCNLLVLHVQITDKRKLSACRAAYNVTFLLTEYDKPHHFYIK